MGIANAAVFSSIIHTVARVTWGFVWVGDTYKLCLVDIHSIKCSIRIQERGGPLLVGRVLECGGSGGPLRIQECGGRARCTL